MSDQSSRFTPERIKQGEEHVAYLESLPGEPAPPYEEVDHKLKDAGDSEGEVDDDQKDKKEE